MQKLYSRTLYGKIICLIKLLILNAILGAILFAVNSSMIDDNSEIAKTFNQFKDFGEFAQQWHTVPPIMLLQFFWPFLLVLVFVIYFFADFCHRKLVVNNNGVYQLGGFMPWNNGYMGVDWTYLESAYFYQGFIPWLLQDYTIELKRSHTERGIRFYHISKAIDAVGAINDIIRGNNGLNPNMQGNMADIFITEG